MQLHRFYWLLWLNQQSNMWKSRAVDRTVAFNIDLSFRNPAETLQMWKNLRSQGALLTRRLAKLRVTHFPLQPSRDLGGADLRRATRIARAAYGREAGALSLSEGASLPPSPLFSRRRCHKVTRSLGSAGFTRAGVRTFDRSVGRSVGRPRFPLSGKYFADKRSRDCAAHDKHTQICTRSSHVSGFSSRLDINRLVNYESR